MTRPTNHLNPVPLKLATPAEDPRQPRDVWIARAATLYEPRVVQWIDRVRDAIPAPD